MSAYTLDMAVMPYERLFSEVDDNKTFVLILFIISIFISSILFNVFVIKKNRKKIDNNNETKRQNNADENAEE